MPQSVDRLQEHLPILVGGNGEALLAPAGELTPTSSVCKGSVARSRTVTRTTSTGRIAHLDDQSTKCVSAPASGSTMLEFNALVQVVKITDDRDAALAEICEWVERSHDGTTPRSRTC